MWYDEPMALEIPIGFAQVTYVMQQAGDTDPYNCTIGIDASLSSASNEDILGQCAAAWVLNILAGQSTGITLTSVRGTFGTDGVDPILVDWPSGAQGPNTQGMLPQNCALLVRKNTLLGGRRNRGRMFVPGILPDGQVDNVGVIGTSVVNGLQVQFNNFLEDLRGEGEAGDEPIRPVILHNFKAGAPLDPTPITSLTVQSVIATQRRRLR